VLLQVTARREKTSKKPDKISSIAVTVIGVALNFRETVNRLAASFDNEPYKKPPVAPVLYLKTPNTWIKPGEAIHCPAGVTQLRMAGTLGIVLGRAVCRVTAENAVRYIGAFCVVNDVSIPHGSYYRPALRERCADSFCAIGAATTVHGRLLEQDFEIDVLVNNVLRCNARTSSLVRPISQLIADISQFMTLQAGDILLVGEPDSAPLCGPGDKVRVEIPGVGSIENKVVATA